MMVAFSKFDKFLVIFFLVVLGIIFVAAANFNPDRPYHDFSQLEVTNSSGVMIGVADSNNRLLSQFGGTGVAFCNDGNVLKWSGSPTAGSWTCGGIPASAGNLPTCTSGSDKNVLVWSQSSQNWACGGQLTGSGGTALPTCKDGNVLMWSGGSWVCGSVNLTSLGLPTGCSQWQVIRWDTKAHTGWSCGDLQVSQGTGIQVNQKTPGDYNISNTGVTKINAGKGITLDPTTGVGDVNVQNGGVTKITAVAGSGVVINTNTGDVNISLPSCAPGKILKSSSTRQWICADDAVGSGGGTPPGNNTYSNSNTCHGYYTFSCGASCSSGDVLTGHTYSIGGVGQYMSDSQTSQGWAYTIYCYNTTAGCDLTTIVTCQTP